MRTGSRELVGWREAHSRQFNISAEFCFKCWFVQITSASLLQNECTLHVWDNPDVMPCLPSGHDGKKWSSYSKYLQSAQFLSNKLLFLHSEAYTRQRGCIQACCSSSVINPASPSMHFIGFEAMWDGVNPARTCATLLPKYRWPRWLIRLEQWATGNTVKKKKRKEKNLPEIKFWQFRDGKTDKRPVRWKPVKINNKSHLLTFTGKNYFLSLPPEAPPK